MSSTTYAVDGEIVSRVRPCLDQVLIEKLRPEKSKGGIILVEGNVSSMPTERGRILKVGPGRYENGQFIEMSLKEHQECLYHAFPSGVEICEGGKKYLIIQEKQVVAILT